MIRINRHPILVATHHPSASLLPLLVAVVAWLAKGLEIAFVVEERFVSPVRLDMVNNSSGHRSPELQTEPAERMVVEEVIPQPPPSRVVSTGR